MGQVLLYSVTYISEERGTGKYRIDSNTPGRIRVINFLENVLSFLILFMNNIL